MFLATLPSVFVVLSGMFWLHGSIIQLQTKMDDHLKNSEQLYSQWNDRAASYDTALSKAKDAIASIQGQLPYCCPAKK
jgi:hypothetical protein